VHFNATLPEHLLQGIDERVSKDQRYSSRSGFLATTALRELDRMPEMQKPRIRAAFC